MAIQSTHAIVLKRKDIRESSIIVTLFTKDFGKIIGLVKGIRVSKSRYASKLESFSLNKIVFYQTQKKDIQLISNCDLEDSFENLRKDLRLTTFASFFVELVDSVTELFDKNEKIFRLFLNSLVLLSKEKFPERAVLIFQIKLLTEAGLMPQVSACAGCDREYSNYKFSHKLGGLICQRCLQEDPEAVNISRGALATVSHIYNSSWNQARRVKPSKKINFEIVSILNNFIEYQLQKKLKSLEFLQRIK